MKQEEKFTDDYYFRQLEKYFDLSECDFVLTICDIRNII